VPWLSTVTPQGIASERHSSEKSEGKKEKKRGLAIRFNTFRGKVGSGL